MYNLRVNGRMTFPHYVSHNTIKKATLTRLEGSQYDEKQKKVVDKYSSYPVSQEAIFKIICRPDQIVKIGERFEHIYTAGASYTILEVIDTHPAKGDWSFVDFNPVVVTLRAAIDSLNVTAPHVKSQATA